MSTATKRPPLTEKVVQERMGAINARIEEIEAWELEAILIELGRLVTMYEVWTAPLLSTDTLEPIPETPLCFWIEYSIDMGHWTFECSGTWPNADGQGRSRATSLRDAAIYAIKGAVSVLGPDA